MKIVNKKVKDIVPYFNNQRDHTDDQLEQISQSIVEFGFIQPIVLDKEGTIVIGHGRFIAGQRVGMKEFPCMVLEDMTPEQIRTLRIADNQLGDNSEWNFEKLIDELKNQSVDMDLLGFTNTELDQLLANDSIFEEDEELAEVLADGKEIPKMERMLNEHNDYVVFVFRNSLDYLQTLERLQIKKVDSSLSEKTKKIGVGRVLDGKKLIELFKD